MPGCLRLSAGDRSGRAGAFVRPSVRLSVHRTDRSPPSIGARRVEEREDRRARDRPPEATRPAPTRRTKSITAIDAADGVVRSSPALTIAQSLRGCAQSMRRSTTRNCFLLQHRFSPRREVVCSFLPLHRPARRHSRLRADDARPQLSPSVAEPAGQLSSANVVPPDLLEVRRSFAPHIDCSLL